MPVLYMYPGNVQMYMSESLKAFIYAETWKRMGKPVTPSVSQRILLLTVLSVLFMLKLHLFTWKACVRSLRFRLCIQEGSHRVSGNFYIVITLKSDIIYFILALETILASTE